MMTIIKRFKKKMKLLSNSYGFEASLLFLCVCFYDCMCVCVWIVCICVCVCVCVCVYVSFNNEKHVSNLNIYFVSKRTICPEHFKSKNTFNKSKVNR